MRLHIEHITIKASLFSKYLERKVKFRLVAPADFWKTDKNFPVLLMNDGQDFAAMQLENTIAQAYSFMAITPFIYVGLEADAGRVQEYGTASSADFKGRGAKATKYSRFIIEEVTPFLKEEFKASPKKEDWVFCGMSLGGLSAFDIVVKNPELFGKVGVLSGSFWWRNKAYVKGDATDRSRIILDVIKNAPTAPHLRFWLECGSKDELADRNNNGIIDAIDDTLDVIKELQKKEYSFPGDITYVQVEGGKHDLPTWGKVFPQFVLWAFGKGR